MEASRLREEAQLLLPGAIELRRRIHRRPELGLVLPETQKAVLESALGSRARAPDGRRDERGGGDAARRAAGADLAAARRHGRAAAPGGHRAGLPLASATERCTPAATTRTSRCSPAPRGSSLRAARELAGTVKFLFQPGEEGYAGARVLIEEGLLEGEPRVEAAFAIHVDSSLPAGCVATRPGPLLAAGDVLLDRSRRPRRSRGAAPPGAATRSRSACEIVMALQSVVTRQIVRLRPGDRDASRGSRQAAPRT